VKGKRALTATMMALGLHLSGCSDDEAQAPLPLWHTEDLEAPSTTEAAPAVVQLGRRLFYDRQLSVNGARACATCHEQAKGFTDGFPKAIGATQHVHSHNALPLVNLADEGSLTWSNSAQQTLSKQMLTPLFGTDPIEMGMDEAELEERLAKDPVYPSLFAAAFGSPRPNALQVTEAIAAFERTIVSINSPFDRYRRGQTQALSATAQRGLDLFFGRLHCDRCHGGRDLNRPTDENHRVTGPPTFHNVGLYNVDGLGGYPQTDQGLMKYTGAAADNGKFRTPTLRNVQVTGPYMHDGTVSQLATAILIHTEGGRNVDVGPQRGDGRQSPVRDPLLAPQPITEEELQALLVFLRSLTDDEFLTNPALAAPH
jgi:cytochrome c peroxidase